VKRLLRGVIDFGDGKISPEGLNSNFLRLNGSKIEWAKPVDGKIYQIVREFFTDTFEVPTATTLRDYFERVSDVEAEERLKDIESAPTYVRKNYEHLLNQLVEDQNRIKMTLLLKDVNEISTRGLIVGEGKEKKKLTGVKDALLYFNQKVHELIPPDNNARTRGNLRDDTQAGWEEYQVAKHNKDKVWGKFTGINNIDKVCHGLKRGEMWVHAAFAGELKTTFATNWCYNLVTRYRTNVLYVSMEMPYEQIRRLIYVIHSGHAKWSLLGYKPLDYRKVRDGELTPEEEAFYQIVLKDFNENPEHCRFEVWCPDRDVSIDDVRVEAELLHKEMEVGFVVLDHGGLMKPRKSHRDYTIELNSVLRDSKKFALHFNGGEGIPTLMLFQINREGKKEADKNEGKYKLNALSYSNECERSADYVTTTYLNDDLREHNATIMCNLKNRDNPLFEPFRASVDFSSRRLFNLDETFSSGSDISADEGDAFTGDL
jgi:replicative DNA helicase